LFGALVTVYLFVGELLPSMGGKAEYEQMKNQSDDLRKRRDAALTVRERFAAGDTTITNERYVAEGEVIADIDSELTRLDARTSSERWRLFLLGFPIYLLLGGFFAAALALDWPQALFIGFAWTAVADRLGLQRELSTRKQIVEAGLTKVEAQGVETARQLAGAERENTQLRDHVATLQRLASIAVATVPPAQPPTAPPGTSGGTG
jgi:hypothetical protein